MKTTDFPWREWLSGLPWLSIIAIASLAVLRPYSWPYPYRAAYGVVVFAAIIRWCVYITRKPSNFK
jgi:hypothetical protein